MTKWDGLVQSTPPQKMSIARRNALKISKREEAEELRHRKEKRQLEKKILIEEVAAKVISILWKQGHIK